MLGPFPDDRQPFGSFLSRQVLAGLVDAVNTALTIHVAGDRTAGVGDARIQHASVQAGEFSYLIYLPQYMRGPFSGPSNFRVV